ncbi:hypothetical protein M9H77_04073 [Catharanthus roseus]|uniref:Uncharacterized protein n=1 Tax=Catharanthus roseus TaxID=4058 RepID=A0ACC0CD90_CATRO|nr:hypothetical protein M9H77_04073 [Catharanthus roseus]
MQCHSRDPQTRFGSQNEVIRIKSRHLVVNPAKHHTSAQLPNNRTPISLVKTSYRLLGYLPEKPAYNQILLHNNYKSMCQDNAYMEHCSYAFSTKQKIGFVDSPGCRSDALILQAGYQ